MLLQHVPHLQHRSSYSLECNGIILKIIKIRRNKGSREIELVFISRRSIPSEEMQATALLICAHDKQTSKESYKYNSDNVRYCIYCAFCIFLELMRISIVSNIEQCDIRKKY